METNPHAQNSYEAECFFVDEVPVRVELKESSDCLVTRQSAVE